MSEKPEKEIEDYIAEYEQEVAKLQNKIQESFSSTLTKLLQESKLIESISWTQYTCYFNDGDECYFSVYAEDLTVNEEDWYDIKDNGKWADETDLVESISSLIMNTPDEIMKSIFGDHCEITVSKNGDVNVSDYENHD